MPPTCGAFWGHGMPLPLAGLAIGAMGLGSALLGARSANRAQRAQQDALNFEKEKWNAGRAFRDRGTALLGQEIDPEAITATFADPGNPYAAQNTFRPLMRASQAMTGPRTAQPRASGMPTPNLMQGGAEMMAPGGAGAGDGEMGAPDAMMAARALAAPRPPAMGGRPMVMAEGGEDLTGRGAQLEALAQPLAKNGYGQYLLNLLK